MTATALDGTEFATTVRDHPRAAAEADKVLCRLVVELDELRSLRATATVEQLLIAWNGRCYLSTNPSRTQVPLRLSARLVLVLLTPALRLAAFGV